MNNIVDQLKELRRMARPRKHTIRVAADRVWSAIDKYTAKGYSVNAGADGSLLARRPGREIKIMRQNSGTEARS